MFIDIIGLLLLVEDPGQVYIGKAIIIGRFLVGFGSILGRSRDGFGMSWTSTQQKF